MEMTNAVCWCRDVDLLFYKDLKNLITRIYVMLYRTVSLSLNKVVSRNSICNPV